MSRIEIISASAGSGKTYRLASVLEEALATGQVRPEGVLATTFTRKAAAELQERARTRLLSHGRFDDAQRLAGARIGTVNAVCGQLVTTYAFELGLSPQLRVLDEQQATQTLSESLATVLEGSQTRELARLEELLQVDWEQAVRRIIELARSNNLTAEDLQRSCERSLAAMEEVYGEARGTAEALDGALVAALQGVVDAYDPAAYKTKGTRDAYARVQKDLRTLKAGRDLPWMSWASLVTLKGTKESEALLAPVQQAAAVHDGHPRLRQHVQACIELVFQVASRALDAYRERKEAWGAIDFVDQEVYALRLLELEAVREDLAAQLDLILVDEFQDTSPLQLAIFLGLARLCPRSVWVGDQKQSIFGFRGTDPSLMDKAVEVLGSTAPTFVDDTVRAVLKGGRVQTLTTSYRSRPELVHLTSNIFVAAFAEHPQEQVRLTPHLDPEPPGLGPTVETWHLSIPNRARKSDYPHAVASGVRQLLSDPTATVRDPITQEVRPVRPGDIAILARRNQTCVAVAAALERLGIRVALPQAGLLASAEGRGALAALRLWMNPRDSLARAELSRLLDYPGAPDAWLDAMVAEPRAAHCESAPWLVALQSAREAHPQAGPVLALELALQAVGLAALCRRWGRAEQRLANLDALRSEAVRYADACAAQGAGCTVAGLYAHLVAAAGDEADRRAVLHGDDAVTVSTWHGSKGLEWPITVLFELDWSRNSFTDVVRIASDRSEIDLEDPLGGRWVRFSVYPYKSNQTTPMRQRLEALPFSQQAKEEDAREQLRLLYVAWTRARDRLVLAVDEQNFHHGILGRLPEGARVCPLGQEGTAWAGRPVQGARREGTPQESVARAPTAGLSYPAREPGAHPPARVRPSSREGRGRVLTEVSWGQRLAVAGRPSMEALGEAVHGFFAADVRGAPAAERLQLAAGLLERWGVADVLNAGELLAAGDRFWSFVEKRWPGARLHREVVLHSRLEDGSELSGVADIVVEAPQGYVVIDHKSFPGGLALARERAGGFAGQLGAYARALGGVAGAWIHLPVLGAAMEVEVV